MFLNFTVFQQNGIKNGIKKPTY
ncbi:hypothetical protein [Staphylococcus simulans]